jgi:hypothetical protein
MQPNETTSKPAGKSNFSRYVIPLVALVVIVGGIAWVAQYLPSWNKKGEVPPPPPKNLVDFRFRVALWQKKRDDFKPKEGEPALELVRDVEIGSHGHYDFPFKNTSGKDLEVISFISTCDCSSVKVGIVSASEWERLAALQDEKPGEDLTYTVEPTWLELGKEGAPEKKKTIPVKADERGFVRIEWHAKKAMGEDLNLRPAILFQAVGETKTMATPLIVPVRMSPPVQFHPARVMVPPIISAKTARPSGWLARHFLTAKPTTKKFDAWSSTRDKLDLQLIPIPDGPHFVFTVREHDAARRAELEKYLVENKLGGKVRSAYEVTLSVYENKEGHQLDQGTYYRRCSVKLDGIRREELLGPEIIGQVRGDILIGGFADQGKISFGSFDAKFGASKEVELGVPAGMTLEQHDHKPSWIHVTLTPPTEKKTTGQQVWKLEVTVQPNTVGARSFGEADAVTLKIVGTPDRFLRIPLDGHISGN